ncbi:MAG: MBL fold metallo-hydrolase, partial [Pseudomonadota bacterium]
LRYGVLTHHHSDHVLGVAPYVNAGATVVAARAHEQVVRDAAPDGAQLTLELVDERRVFDDDGQRVEIIDIGPTAHTEHLLVAWLPDSGLLFEADHFARPRTGVIPAANDSTRTFAEALRKHGLTPLRISSAHSPDLATPADLRLALESTPKATKAPMVKF